MDVFDFEFLVFPFLGVDCTGRIGEVGTGKAGSEVEVEGGGGGDVKAVDPDLALFVDTVEISFPPSPTRAT